VKAKKALLHLALRVGVLILALLVMVALWYFTNNPHKRCIGDEHMHVDTGLGLVVGGFIVFIMWCLAIFIEMIYNFIKKKKDFKIDNKSIIVFIILFLACVVFVLL
jgi:hypothetical protein